MMQIINKYSHNPKACVSYFFNMKQLTGFYCEKCGCVHYYFLENRNTVECTKYGHQHYFFPGTIFQDSKLPFFKLILSQCLFISANKSCSAIEMTSQLNVVYKTALRLCRKCRILVTLSNSKKIQVQVYNIYIDAKTEEKSRNGVSIINTQAHI